MMRPGPFFLFRLVTLIAAFTIGIFAVWITAAEILHPRLVSFPGDARDAQTFAAARNWTRAAALTGMVRGELWTAAAIAEAAPFVFETDSAKRAAFSQPDLSAAHVFAVQAAKLSPYDSRNWLLLAALGDMQGTSGTNVTEALKLSYYTGSGDLALAPLRLSIATRSAAISDEDLKTFVSLEIAQVATKLPAMKPMLASAYANANADGRKTIEAALAPIDPALLNTIRRR